MTIDIDHVADATPDLREAMLDRLRKAVPEAFVDGKLDVVNLASLAGEATDTAAERYGLTWPGKREAIAMLQAPTRATLAPDRAESTDFDKAEHVFIEGENLEVLKVLHRSYQGRVKLIYIDPPYNTGKDFIYPDDFADPLDRYLRITGQKDAAGDLLTSLPERSGRFHSNWLSMMYPRLSHARQLLREDGFIVVSIDDAEQANLVRLMDEVFGEENRVAVLVYDRNRKNDAKLFSVGHEYMVVYARNKAWLKESGVKLRAPKEGVEEVRAEFDRLRDIHGSDWTKIRADLISYYNTFEDEDPRLPLARFNKVDEKGPYRDDGDVSWPGGGGPRYRISHPVTRKPVKQSVRGWLYPTRKRFIEMCAAGRIVFGPDEKTVPAIRSNLFEADTQVMHSVTFSYAQTATQQFNAIFDNKKVFDNPKSYADLERLVRYLSEPGDIVLDFFAGSNTTLHGVLRANIGERTPRRGIAVQMAEPIEAGSESGNNALALGLKTLADVSRERIRRVLAEAEHKNTGANVRCFKIAASNTQRWKGVQERTVEAYQAQLDAFMDTLTPGWKVEDVIWEVALREGYSLTSRVEPVAVPGGGTFHRVTDPERGWSFMIGLDDALTFEQVRSLGLSRDDLFVCRDTALDDTLAANLALQCRLKVI
ncbi:site-specific DNA-methyltransferase [Brevundimonas sp. KM4]|uniref:site-specific DNA-methyltransferase n=1 Tax=Brevundimonas sp. KM4 TaxID=1628191 RepID=UPI0005F7A125|nr:site-specific DNA-methyltransferase [Brevundimonas sp. KM4]KJV41508.1 hypothetical protein VH88_08630 [Brevundimonas sp. KM4]